MQLPEHTPNERHFLSKRQRYQQVPLPDEFSDEELARDWTLSSADLKFLASFNGCDLDLMFGFSGVLASRTDRASPEIVATDLGSASTNVDSIQSPHPCLSSASPIGTSAV